VVLILGIGTVAATALAIWRRLKAGSDEFSAVAAVTEARRTAGVVNAVAYAFAVIMDAMMARRTVALATAGASSPQRTPMRIGSRAGDTPTDDD
jgi:hypothetical protein